MVRKILGGILIYSFVVYIIVSFWPAYDFYAIRLDPPNSLQNTPLFLMLGGIFRLIYDVIRHVLKLITLPLNWISFGLVHILLNIWLLYAFPYIVNALDIGVTMTMWSLVEVLIMAFHLLQHRLQSSSSWKDISIWNHP